MLDHDNQRFIESAFQPKPEYEDVARSPFTVTGQTNRLLKLLLKEGFSDFSFGKRYIDDYTMPYLRTARENCDVIFDGEYRHRDTIGTEPKETASHAFIIFGSLPDMTSIPNSVLKDGFSRGGILRAPESKHEYISRIREIEAEISKIADGATTTSSLPVAKVPLFRTLIFFTVADFLTPSFHLSPREKELREKQEEDAREIRERLSQTLRIQRSN